jgi:hypothetical protein
MSRPRRISDDLASELREHLQRLDHRGILDAAGFLFR